MREAVSPVVNDAGTSMPDVGASKPPKQSSMLPDLAYRLLNVHMHLLDVVDPRGIQGAGCV